MLALSSPASAAEFQFVGDGFSQTLHWIWSQTSTGGTFTSCLTSQFNPCGAVFASNGEIPLSGSPATANDFNAVCLIVKGKLDWSAGPEEPTGQLSAVATTWVREGRYFVGGSQCTANSDAWVSVDARDVPLEFLAIRGMDDPPTLTLAVSPRLDGTISQQTWIGTSKVTLQYMVAVRVNGVEVTGDTLNTVVSVLEDSTELNWTPQLPDGAANDVVIPGLPWNSQISISLWAYMRGETEGNGRVFPMSSFGEGLALVVDAWAANAVAVEPAAIPGRLSLSALPNPVASAARIQYTLPEAAATRIAVYDVTGSRVSTLADRFEPAGKSTVTWDGRDGRGSRLAPGVYWVELVAGSRRTVTKVALLR